MKNKSFAFILATIISVAYPIPMFAATSPAPAPKLSPFITVAAQKYTAKSTQVQHFATYVNLRPGQDKLPLTLTYQNGSDRAPAFTHLRISSPDGSYISEKNFKSDHTFVINLNDAVTWGTNQILISGDGPYSATLYWTLTTPRPAVTDADPAEVFSGQGVLIKGKNLPSDASLITALLNGVSIPVTNASAQSFQVTIPAKTHHGAGTLKVSIGGVDAGTVKIKLKAWPTIDGLSSNIVSANTTLLIYGENFSTNSQDISVTIGPNPAKVLRSTDTAITVQVPSAFGDGYLSGYPDWYLPVTVTVGGVMARNRVSLNVGVQ